MSTRCAKRASEARYHEVVFVKKTYNKRKYSGLNQKAGYSRRKTELSKIKREKINKHAAVKS